MSIAIPTRGEDFTAPLLSELVGVLRPGVSVSSAHVVSFKTYGQADEESAVSTSSQIKLDVEYAGAGSELLPRRLFAKVSFPAEIESKNPELGVWFENEVLFYNKIRTSLDIEAPVAMGGRFDRDSSRFVLLMGDLSPRKPHMNSMADAPSVAVMQSVLAELARLHAHFWQSPRLKGDLSWTQNQTDGTLEKLFDTSVRVHIKNEVARDVFKRELIEELATTEEELYQCMKAVKRHQATLPQTLLHGDAHFGNSYFLPDGSGGLLDWQACARGHLMHDVAYMIQSGLSVALRRQHERDLLKFYREKLHDYGVKDAPSFDDLWLEYRRGMIYGFHMGWLTVPEENYGWERMVVGNHRTKVACLDHDSIKLANAVLWGRTRS